jgi:hypothetical protein
LVNTAGSRRCLYSFVVHKTLTQCLGLRMHNVASGAVAFVLDTVRQGAETRPPQLL